MTDLPTPTPLIGDVLTQGPATPKAVNSQPAPPLQTDDVSQYDCGHVTCDCCSQVDALIARFEIASNQIDQLTNRQREVEQLLTNGETK